MALSLAEVPAKRNPEHQGVSLETLNNALSIGEHALALFIHLTNQAEEDRVTITIEKLCDLSDLSKNTVKKYLTLLEDRGIIATLQKGQWRGLPTIYQLEPTVIYPTNIVNFVTEKGSNDARKGSNSNIDPWMQEAYDAGKGSNSSPFVYVQGVNDSEERGQRQSKIPPTPPSSNSRDINTTNTGSSVDFTSAQWLLTAPEVRAVMQQYRMTDHLVIRSLRDLQTQWQKQKPRTPRAAASRAAKWLISGENNGIHNAWRREAPYEMAGAIPL